MNIYFQTYFDCVSDNKRVFFPHINSYFNYHFGLLSSDSHPASYAWIRQNWSNHHYFFHQSYIRIWFLPPWCFIRILRRTYEALLVWFNLNCLCRIGWKDLLARFRCWRCWGRWWPRWTRCSPQNPIYSYRAPWESTWSIRYWVLHLISQNLFWMSMHFTARVCQLYHFCRCRFCWRLILVLGMSSQTSIWPEVK